VIPNIIILQQIEDVLNTVLTFYHENLGVSWGWSIVLLTATVRILILPITVKQLRSMAAMQRVQPKMKAIQNKYKGKPEMRAQQQAEIMELYKEHGVNPFASCLPLVVQLPVFIGLYRTLSAIHVPPGSDTSFLFINDIFVKTADLTPEWQKYLIVAAYSLSMLGSTLLFSFVQDRQQKIIFASMSVIFIPFILRVQVGVGIYWITTNLWTIAQQGIVKRTMGHHFPVFEKEKEEKQKRKTGPTKRTSRNPKKDAEVEAPPSATPEADGAPKKAQPQPSRKKPAGRRGKGGSR
jgi:YidC/Oxa1 family membrane protein insertase